MGRAYSVEGFLNAALRRSGKTILVEGPTDKNVLHRVALERFPEEAGLGVIDHVGILEDPVLAGLGNRARVLHVQRCADDLSASAPKIAAALGTLIDREWDGVTFNAYVPDPEWRPPSQGHNRFITQGHSIENYHLDVECAKEYLKYAFAGTVNAQIFQAVESRFPAILVLATVLSLKIREDACLSRSAGLFDISHLAYGNERYHLDAAFAAPCAARQFVSAATIVADVNQGIDAAWDRLHAHAGLKWRPHGHVGDEITWVGVAHAALEAGISQDVANEIAHGRKRDRERFKAQWLSKSDVANRVPLDVTIEWLHS